MAKMLNIGVKYWPNHYVKGQDGKRMQYPSVVFYFNCDPSTAQAVVGSNVTPNLKMADGSSVVKVVPVKDYERFIFGHGAFEKLINLFGQYGYEFDLSDDGREDLAESVEQVIENTLDDEGVNMINKGNADFIDKIIEAMEQNLNDPNFMAYVNSVGRICFVGKDKIFNATKLSTDNALLILSQWVNSGRSGNPTYLATKRQWAKFYNRQPKSGAKPLYAIRPRDVTSRSVSSVRNEFGIGDNEWADARVQHSVDMLSRDDQYGQKVNHKFMMETFFPYYDLSETELIPGMPEIYDFQNNRPINVDPNASKEDVQKNRDELINSTSGSTKKEEAEIVQSITVYAKKHGDAMLEQEAAKGAVNAIRYMADNSALVRRDNEPDKARANAALLTALVLKRFQIQEKVSDRLMVQGMAITGGVRYGINRQRFRDLSSEFENIVSAILGLTESATNNTLMWVLQTLGISVEEYKSMPENEEEAMAMENGVRESFIHMFNKIILR